MTFFVWFFYLSLFGGVYYMTTYEGDGYGVVCYLIIGVLGSVSRGNLFFVYWGSTRRVSWGTDHGG